MTTVYQTNILEHVLRTLGDGDRCPTTKGSSRAETTLFSLLATTHGDMNHAAASTATQQ
jgi:hypothetical protein